MSGSSIPYYLAMKIFFDEIPEAGLALEIHDATWFPDGDWTRIGPVRADLHLTRRDQRVFLVGQLQFINRFECDRCLEAYEDKHDDRFQVEFEYIPPTDLYWHSDAGEHECPEAEMDVVTLDQPALDVEAILEQQVILALPVKRVCADNCRGLCVYCGKNLNSAPCSCQENESKSPFKALAQIKGR